MAKTNPKALELIAKNKQSKATFLDLGNLGLTEWPEELFELPHLEELNLGADYLKKKRWKKGKRNYEIRVESKNKFGQNNLQTIPGNVKKLKNLKKLHLSQNKIKDGEEIQKLATINLKYIDLNYNFILKIDGFQNLKHLERLDLSMNWIKEMSGLEHLTNLIQLNLSFNLIEEVFFKKKLKSLKELNLASNNILEINGLEKVMNLTKLQIGTTYTPSANYESINYQILELFRTRKNQIKEIKNLESLPRLKTLSLSNNQIKEIKNLESLPRLKTLNLSGNQIKEIKNLESLPRLKTLNLSENQIKEIKNLESLPHLYSLDLSKNQIKETKNLESLSRLKTLNLWDNQIKEIKNLDYLISLNILNLFNNQIVEVKNLDKLVNLKEIDLDSNPLRKISGLGNLKFLEAIDLRRNKISDIDILKKNKFLVVLYLQNNQLNKFKTSTLKMPYLSYLNCSENPFSNIPPELVSQDNCLQDAKNWFKDLAKESVENFEVKLILAGNGRVGKTCILKRFFFDKFNQHESSTHGVQLYSKDFEVHFSDKKLRINAWDFGGQEVYHATHRLFMQSRAVYLIVWDKETEEKPIEYQNIDGYEEQFKNYKLPYWFENARSLSWRSPLIVVQNKIDIHPQKLPDDSNKLQKKYEISEFRHVSSANGKGFSGLKMGIIEELQNMWEIGMKMPGQWLRIKEKLLKFKPKNKTFPYSNYLELCRNESLSDSSAKSLIHFLHNTGVLFYNGEVFEDQIILDQAWALDGIYAVYKRGPFYKMLKFAKGKTSFETLSIPWEKYDTKTRKVFLSMMETCELCFQVEEDKKDPEYIIVGFLPEEKYEKVSSFWKEAQQSELFLLYQPNFFHSSIIKRFISRAGRLAKNYDHLWKNGIWISYRNMHALIESFPEKQEILVRVKGSSAQFLLFLIHKEFNEIIYDMENVNIQISNNGEDFAKYSELKESKDSLITNTRKHIEKTELGFFEEILEAKNESQAKKWLSDIVPKPKQKDQVKEINYIDEVVEKVKALVIVGNLEGALKKLYDLTKPGDFQNDLIGILSNYNDLKKTEIINKYSPEKLEERRNRLQHGFLTLLGSIKKKDLDLEKIKSVLEEN